MKTEEKKTKINEMSTKVGMSKDNELKLKTLRQAWVLGFKMLRLSLSA
jgi:hypothetical protein